MKRIALLIFVILGLSNCKKDDFNDNLEYYIRFIANDQKYELSYVTCQYFYDTLFNTIYDETHIYGVKSRDTEKEGDSSVVDYEIPEVFIITPSNSIGSWTQADSLRYFIRLEDDYFYGNSIDFNDESIFEVSILEYGDKGEYCIGNFSGIIKSEGREDLRVKEGTFKIKVGI
ncbi:hypothetical protein ACFLTE_09810 [Bacteroidota bacterium]